MPNIGFRIFTKINRPARELVEFFKDSAVANISDNMSRFSCVDAQIKPLNNARLLGTAFTVKSRTADNLMVHKALNLAQPGDVIVVDVQGDMVNAVCGEIMIRIAMKKGIAGFLIDGAVRDLGMIKQMDFPVYAKGATPKGPYKDGPGEINVPVSIGGVVVRPGDIIVGDEDGVVVIDPTEAVEIFEKTKLTIAKEAKKLQSIEDGTNDESWIDHILQQKGCEIIID